MGDVTVSACPACGETVTPPGLFCEACGHDLSAPAVAVGQASPPATCPGCGSTKIDADRFCDECGRKAPSGRDHAQIDIGGMVGVSDRGLRHHRNEDAMALAAIDTPSGPAAIAVVCDGVSSSDRPDEASLAGANAAARVLTAALRSGDDPADASTAAITAAAQAVTDLGDPDRPAESTPAATYVAAVIRGETVTVCWAGDSRAYWLPADTGRPARQLTKDDSWAEELIAEGMSEAEAQASPQAHQITRWLGADGRAQDPGVTSFEPPERGFILLCSDGLWNYRPDPAGLAALTRPAARTDLLAAASALVKFALDAGGQDNITVVLARFPWPPPDDATHEATVPVTIPANIPAQPAKSGDPGSTPT